MGEGTATGLMLLSKRHLKIVASAEELSRSAAELFARVTNEAVRTKGSFTVALAGGSTPKSLYSLLASETWRTQLPWPKMHFFWSDERHVPPDHQDSNYRMAYDAMLAHVPVTTENVHRIQAEHPNAEQVARNYEQALRPFFHLKPRQFPSFDLVLLGMGADGHTASLFPGTKALHESERLVAANWVEKLNGHRITLTVPTLNNAAFVIFLVSGAEKADTLREVFSGDERERFPVQLIRPTEGELIWLVDRAAASYLPVE